MAEKDAKVRLNLAASGFLTQLQALRKASEEFEHAIEGTGAGAEKASRKISAFGSAAKAGFGAAKGAIVELGHSLKSAITMVATLGGALSVAGSVRGAVELQRSYKDIAFGLEAGTGKAVSWQAVQAKVEGTANRWSQSNKDVSATFADMAVRMNDVGKASAATDKIAEFAAAGVGPMDALRRITASLTEQFMIKPEGLGQALAQTVSLSRAAGVSIEELDPKMAQLGATAKGMGFEGSAGLQKMLGMLVLAKGAGKNARQTFTEVADLFTKLSDPNFLKDVGTKQHLHLEDHGTPKKHVMEMIIAKAGGKNEELAKLFSGPDLLLVEKFGAIYKKAADDTKGDLKAKMTAGLAALDAAMKKAGQSNLDEAAVLKQAASNQQDAGAAFTKAMNTLEQAFTKPQMIKAIDQIAEKLPALAEAIAKMLGWALDHPKTAALGLLGAKVIPPVALAVGTNLAVSVIKKLATRGAGSAATKLAAAEGTTAATAAEGTTAATAAEGTTTAGTVAAGGVTAATGVATAAGVVALAMGGAIGYELAKPKSGLRKRDGTMQGVTDVSQPGTPEDYDRIMAEEKRKADKRAGISEVLNGFRYGGGAVAGVGGGGRNASGAHAKQESTVDAFVKSLKSGGDAGARTAMSLTRAAEAADLLTSSMTRLGTPAGTNGLPPNPGDMSGSAPR